MRAKLERSRGELRRRNAPADPRPGAPAGASHTGILSIPRRADQCWGSLRLSLPYPAPLTAQAAVPIYLSRPSDIDGLRRQCGSQRDRDPQRQQYTPTREVDRNALSQSVGAEVDVSMRDPKRHVRPRQHYRQKRHLPCRDRCHAPHVEQHRRLKQVRKVTRRLRGLVGLGFPLIDPEIATAELSFFDGARSPPEQRTEHEGRQRHHRQHRIDECCVFHWPASPTSRKPSAHSTRIASRYKAGNCCKRQRPRTNKGNRDTGSKMLTPFTSFSPYGS